MSTREPLRLDVEYVEGDEDAVLTALARYLIAVWREEGAAVAAPAAVLDEAQDVAA